VGELFLLVGEVRGDAAGEAVEIGAKICVASGRRVLVNSDPGPTVPGRAGLMGLVGLVDDSFPLGLVVRGRASRGSNPLRVVPLPFDPIDERLLLTDLSSSPSLPDEEDVSECGGTVIA
jgi:hypothetical protein